MQNIAIQVQDDYFSSFMNYINNHSEKITIAKDKNLEIDPHEVINFILNNLK